MKNEKDVICFFCPPLKDFPKQPSDVSPCTLVPCPECKEQMWLSEKKKKLMAGAIHPTTVFYRCYDCFKDYALKHPEMFKNHTRVDI